MAAEPLLGRHLVRDDRVLSCAASCQPPKASEGRHDALPMCLHGESHDVTYFGASIVHQGEKLAAHAWVPELLQMIGNAFQRLVAFGHGFKKLADAVGHMDQVVGVQGIGPQAMSSRVSQ